MTESSSARNRQEAIDGVINLGAHRGILMNTRKKTSTARGSKESRAGAGALGRKASAVKRQQKKDAITAAMDLSQRRGAGESALRIPPALGRAVEAAKRGKKKATITKALVESQRATGGSRRPASESLERKVATVERLHKKERVTAALKASQRRTAPRES